MNAVRTFVFAVLLLQLSWIVMTAAHEVGHVAGAVLTGGRVVDVLLMPWQISGTTVRPNPFPGVVVWLGPVVGCVLPLLPLLLPLRRFRVTRFCVQFVAGFCLLANGAYIGVGSYSAVGDCQEMYRSGTPQWVMLVFGLAAAGSGLVIWHRQGRVADLRDASTIIRSHHVVVLLTIVFSAVVTELLLA